MQIFVTLHGAIYVVVGALRCLRYARLGTILLLRFAVVTLLRLHAHTPRWFADCYVAFAVLVPVFSYDGCAFALHLPHPVTHRPRIICCSLQIGVTLIDYCVCVALHFDCCTVDCWLRCILLIWLLIRTFVARLLPVTVRDSPLDAAQLLLRYTRCPRCVYVIVTTHFVAVGRCYVWVAAFTAYTLRWFTLIARYDYALICVLHLIGCRLFVRLITLMCLGRYS